VLGIVLLAAIPWKILAAGWLPRDDVRRHAAKAVSGRDWSEIVVLRDGAAVDEHPGWHAVLGAVHRAGAETPRAVAAVAVATPALLFLLAPLGGFRPTEAWPAALAVVALADPPFWYRLLSGRPFAISMAALALLLVHWRRLDGDRVGPGAWVGFSTLLGGAIWMHGNWYLWLLPVAAFAVARRTRAALRLTGCLAAGTIVAALLSGHPVAFVVQPLAHLLWSLAGDARASQLVTEFQPGTANMALLLSYALLLLWRRPRPQELARDPSFVLAVGGTVLGFWVSRFASDWAEPALLVWSARELEVAWRTLRGRIGARTLASLLAFGVTFLAVTGNRKDRWRTRESPNHLRLSGAETAAWLPEPGGILYSTSMGLFYDTFFAAPDAPWRYVLGYEPGLMPDDDLATFRDIQRRKGADAAYLPWIRKMGPRDRLVLTRGRDDPPKLPMLEWASPQSGLWIGRLPRGSVATEPAAASPAD